MPGAAARGLALQCQLQASQLHARALRTRVQNLAGQHIGFANEVGHKAAGRALMQFARAAHLRHHGVVHDHNRVGYGQGFFLVVRDINDGELEGLLQVADFLAHAPAQLGIQVGQWFVKQQDHGLEHQCPGHGDTLLLTA